MDAHAGPLLALASPAADPHRPSVVQMSYRAARLRAEHPDAIIDGNVVISDDPDLTDAVMGDLIAVTEPYLLDESVDLDITFGGRSLASVPAAPDHPAHPHDQVRHFDLDDLDVGVDQARPRPGPAAGTTPAAP